MRILTTDIKNAIEQSRVRMCYLLYISIPGFAEPLLLSTTPHSLNLGDGNEWLGAGSLLEIKMPDEDSTLEIHNAEITLNGLDVATISMALNMNLEYSTCAIYTAFFHPDTNVYLGSLQYLRGTISNVRIAPPTTSTNNG